MNNDKAQQTKLLDISDDAKIFQEVKFIVTLINPQFNFQYFNQAALDVEKLVFLFHEFEEAKVPGFESELDLQEKPSIFKRKRNRCLKMI